jgi:hypothetical protein
MILAAAISACEMIPHTNSAQLPNSSRPKTAAFRMKMTGCDCVDYSLWGDTRNGSSLYFLAGTGIPGSGADNVLATTSAITTSPASITTDSAGNIYFVDYYRHQIKMVPKEGGTYFDQSMTENYVYTIAGTGATGNSSDGTVATSADLYVTDIVVDPAGNVYFNDGGRIRVLPAANGSLFGVNVQKSKIYTIIGTGVSGLPSNGTDAISADIAEVNAISLDSIGNIVFSMYNYGLILMVPRTSGAYYGMSMTANKTYYVAGGGSALGDNGPATSAQLGWVWGLAFDGSDNLYIADKAHQRIRMIAHGNGPAWGSYRTAGDIYTLAGNGTAGSSGDGGLATSAQLNYPWTIALDGSGNLILTESHGGRVRMMAAQSATNFGQVMAPGYIYTIAGGGSGGVGSLAAVAGLGSSPTGLTVDRDDNVYFGAGNAVQMITKCEI